MKCHYEVLNVSRDASESEIKSAYRKLVLKCHPDKNLENQNEAKDRFQSVQQAYDVLGDSHERAWYDKHREQILHGGRNGAEYKDDSVDVFQYFTTSCFSGYDDDENGFYAVYRNVFLEIMSEDVEYMDSKEEFETVPEFGNSRSDYDEVVGPFYAYWAAYSTRKSYVWLDPYDIRETKDRKVCKLIEKENKKIRTKARKERNEEVRTLVAFVRRRDRRVQANVKRLEQRALENRTKQEKIRLERLEERKRELSLAKEKQQEWSKFENVRSELEEIERYLATEFGEELSDSDTWTDESDGRFDEECDPLSSRSYCAACNKVFKTSRAFENHESSKKHRENVEKLKGRMLNEEEEVDGDERDSRARRISPDAETTDAKRDDGSTVKNDSKSKKNRKKKTVVTFDDDDDDETNGNEFTLEIDGLSKKQKKKNRREESILASCNKTNGEKRTQRTERSTEESAAASACDGGRSEPTNDIAENEERRDDDASRTRRVKQNGTKNANKKAASRAAVPDVGSTCAVCESIFPSKNKLFDHLKKSGHSVPLQEKIACSSMTKTNRKRK